MISPCVSKYSIKLLRNLKYEKIIVYRAKNQNQIDFYHTNYYNIAFSDLAVKYVENNRIIL